MKATSMFFIGLLAAAPLACSDDGDDPGDATVDGICTPGEMRCDPEGRPWIQQCSDDGMRWEDKTSCDGLCHEATCYPRLDASSG